MPGPGQLKKPQEQQEHKDAGKRISVESLAMYKGPVPIEPGCQFSLAPAPPGMKPMHCVRDGVVASTYPVLFVGVIFPVGAGATIGDAKTYYLLELATAKLHGWFSVEHCFFDLGDAQAEAARQRQAK